MEEMLYLKEKRKRRRKRKRVGGGCKSEFDYHGWEIWGLWRGEKRFEYVAEGGIETENENEKGGEKRDCWNNCAYPSECLNKIQRAAQAKLAAYEEEREWNAILYAGEEPQALMDVVVLGGESDGDVGFSAYLGDIEHGEILGSQVYAPFEHENEGERTATGKCTDPPEDLYYRAISDSDLSGPVGIDPSSGLSLETESTFLQLSRVRRNSSGGNGISLRPSSPLKISFGLDDDEVGKRDMAMGGMDVRAEGSIQNLDFAFDGAKEDRECGNW